MVHHPRRSHGDKVLNRPTVLAMWGVTLIDVPRWISLRRLCGKLSAALSLHAGTLSLQHGGRSNLKDIKQICRFGEHKRSVWSCLSPSPAAHFIRAGSPCGVLFLSWRGRQTASPRTWSVSALRDCQSPVPRDRKSSGQNYHLSKQSICLLGAWGQKVRGNPRNSHFGLCLWQGVTLSGYTGVLYAEHIRKRHLSRAPVLGSDTSLQFVAD